ncbi:HAMP domain-containing sensor histidine kinase [Enterococcus timonensis]|uniref:HAMP domain-containing sensor histidine kinase n=1 Tax=Enterococcus timonensis TaxID=1852364 RepID=UPI000D095E6A|nr:HAMP domain-containing histidine kinase [Enterococcus timonensis]
MKKLAIKGPSLTVKWALASSFFIFVVFTIFAVFTYKTTSNLMIGRERNNLAKTMDQLVDRLSVSESELTYLSAIHQLTEVNTYMPNNSASQNNPENQTSPDNQTDPENQNSQDSQSSQSSSNADSNLPEYNSFVSDLSQPELSVYVYNRSGKLIFNSQGEALELAATQKKEPTIVTRQDKTGFITVVPIYSQKAKNLVGYGQAFYDLSPFFEIQERLLTTLIILEVISLLLSSVLGFFLSSYFLKPVKVLRDTMDTIRRDPQSMVKAPVLNTHDELADLSEIFNEMMERMRRYIEQQEQFVQDVSHELRTPVAIIEGHLKLLDRWGKDDPEVLEESLSASLQEISRMKMLVQEMLDLSRAEQVDIQYYDKTSEAKEVVHQIYHNFELLYPDFKFTLDDELDQEETVAIYRNHFEQMMIIILDNAVKYSTKRKEVHISMDKGTRYLELAIQDFGEGIPKDEVEKIFNRFYRVDKARSRNQGGNGLGLAIAKQLIDNYKGKIHAESVLGYGTVFRIFLPIVPKKEIDS